MWRVPTEADIATTLNQREIDMYRALPDFKTSEDPVMALVLRTAAFVRGFCRRNKQVVVAPVEYSIPESLISAAMDYAAFDVLKRLPLEVGESRNKAREAALELFKSVASGDYTPESYFEDATPEDDASSNLALPGWNRARRKILNEYL